MIIFSYFLLKKKTANEMATRLEFRRVLFRSLTEKDFAWDLKSVYTYNEMKGSELVELVRDQAGIEINKGELYSFLLEYCKNPDGNAFNYYGMKRWEN